MVSGHLWKNCIVAGRRCGWGEIELSGMEHTGELTEVDLWFVNHWSVHLEQRLLCTYIGYEHGETFHRGDWSEKFFLAPS